MKYLALAIMTAALATLGGGSALAQAMSPPVTMQPIPNPPEKMKAHAHKAKAHKKAAAPMATSATVRMELVAIACVQWPE